MKNKILLTPIALVASILASGVYAQTTVLEEVTVTGTREAVKKSDTSISVGVLNKKDVEFMKPTHPSEIVGLVPGAAISVTNGEGHQTAIRQGFSTSPVYLFLEDGIPIRATGNFNHNALYEVNIPSSGGVEVIRGVGNALYGSDAIGGIVNILTKVPSRTEGGDASLELGSFGYRRLLAGYDSGLSEMNGALRSDINITHTDGWRNKTAYDRQSANLRWDTGIDQFTVVKTILGYTKIDQETGANSALPYDYFMNSPKTNLRSVGYRKVDAFRLSTEVQKDIGNGQQLTVIPYLRNNKMDLNGTYNFTGDARIEKTEVTSYGLMIKYRNDFKDAWKTKLISGIDFDYSPSSRTENPITLSSTGSGAYKSYNSYTVGATTQYDYDAVYRNLAPYFQLESSPISSLKTILGIRYDSTTFDMSNNKNAGYTQIGSNYYYSPTEASSSFSHLSPKIGFVYSISSAHVVYGSYNQGFRSPSESQIFRGGRAATQANALALFNAASHLKPIIADQYELGTRGTSLGWNYELVAYELIKRDDLLSQRDDTGYSVQTNNGKTKHRGIELALGKELMTSLRFDSAISYAKHEYASWVTDTVNYTGKEIEAAPRWLTNSRLTYSQGKAYQSQIEWIKIGSYYLDAANAGGKYSGHNLFNVRHTHSIDKNIDGFIRVTNIFDKRYADSASWSSSNGATYSPGLPRTIYVGLASKF